MDRTLVDVPWSVIKAFSQARSCGLHYIDVYGAYWIRSFDGPFSLSCMINKSDPASDDQADFETNFKSNCNNRLNPIGTDGAPIAANTPFAEPLYRTKLDATTEPTQIVAGGVVNIDYTVPAERWVYGGEGLVINAQPGDWYSACVVDALGLIPEAYRAALCEPTPGYPVLNTYVPKQWVLVSGGGQNTIFKINTYPLIAKVMQGLVLRVVYHAAEVGETRTVYSNYFLTLKL